MIKAGPEHATQPNDARVPRVGKEHKLTTKQVAAFVADGLLEFPELVPDEINQLAVKQFDEGVMPGGGGYKGDTLLNDLLSDVWQGLAVADVFKLPQVQGIIQSLVGYNPRYDHHAVHKVQAENRHGQIWHADAIIDTRIAFDIQLFYFAHDTPREMGGTMFLPGSQYRRVNETDIARYQNFLGQRPTVCKAGTVLVGHHGMWHCAQPNLTGKMRYMFKLRLNPMVRQLKLWNTDDLNDPELRGILSRDHKWYGNEIRIEQVNRVRQWRYLTGDDDFDVAMWMTRLENDPQTVAMA